MHLEHISLLPESDKNFPPLLFVHGAWHGAWCWEPHFLPYFAQQGFEVHAMSFRAHGASEGNQKTRGLRFTNYVHDLDQIYKTFTRPPILIGHSLGGSVVQKYLETYDYQGPGAVLFASIPPVRILSSSSKLLLFNPVCLLKSLFTFSLSPFVSKPRLVKKFFFSAGTPKEIVETYQPKMQDESVLVLIDMTFFSQIRPQQVRKRHPQLPIHVIGASNDGVLSRSIYEITAKCYQTQADFIPDVGHDIMLEPKWQVAADNILDWIKTLGEKE
jgi:pimeloyl-ACP methyl ester carboxylesterase